MRTRNSRKCEERDGDSLNLMDQFGDSNSPLKTSECQGHLSNKGSSKHGAVGVTVVWSATSKQVRSFIEVENVSSHLGTNLGKQISFIEIVGTNFSKSGPFYRPGSRNPDCFIEITR